MTGCRFPWREIKRRRKRMEREGSAGCIGKAYDDIHLADEASPTERAYYRDIFSVFESYLASAGGRLLEVGVGKGFLLQEIKNRRPDLHLTGIDVALSHVKHCRPWAKVCVSAAEALPFRDGSFRFVICNGVIEHLLDEQGGLNEMARVLAPGGLLYIVTDNAVWQVLMEIQNRLVPRRFKYRRFQQPIDDDFTPRRLKRMIQKSGFSIRAWEGSAPLALLPGHVVSKFCPQLARLPGFRWFAKILCMLAVKA